jgi:hypothetical protein
MDDNSGTKAPATTIARRQQTGLIVGLASKVALGFLGSLMLAFRALASKVFSAIHVSTHNYDSDISNNWQAME